MDLRYKMKKAMIFWICMILLANVVLAIPVPHSIKGVVYDLDGITQVRQMTYFNVTNLDAGNHVFGIVGKGPHTGRYSVVIEGVDGDRISMLFWNMHCNVSRNVTLHGVLDNVNLFINDSIPNNPPVIISTPPKKAEPGKLYVYDVDAVDVESQELHYSLLFYPNGMAIDRDSGLITWMPPESDIGKHDVMVVVEDRDGLTANQSFEVHVLRKGIPNRYKIFKSKSGGMILNRIRGRAKQILLSIFQQEVEEEQNVFTITEEEEEIKQPEAEETYPVGLITGQIVTEPLTRPHLVFGRIESEDDSRKTIVTVEDSSGNKEEFLSFRWFGKEYYINLVDMVPDQGLTITGKKNQLTGFAVSNFSSRIISQDLLLDENTYEKPAYTFAGAEYYFDKPSFFRNPDKPVYAYLIVKDRGDIEFIVGKEWLIENDINKDNIVMTIFYDGKYEEYAIEYLDENADFLRFRADRSCRDCNHFIITLSDVEKLKEKMETSLEQSDAATKLHPFLIKGVVYVEENIQLSSNSTVEIINLDKGKTFNTTTGIGRDSGGFAVIVYGERDDAMLLRVLSERIFESEFNLTGDMRLDIR